MDELLIAKDIHKSFHTNGQELHILKGINIAISKGEMIAVMGASGVGKSTLLNILGALDRPTAGEVIFEGSNIFENSDDELACLRNRKIGFVFQFHHLLPEFTALENTIIPAMILKTDRRKAMNTAEGLLTKVGLKDRMRHRPGELSGGEQQRVAIARALMTGPDIILADEPTGNLDTHTGDEVFALLKNINHEYRTTFVVVTHNERLAMHTDRILKMIDGQIAEERKGL
ncbi:MAG: ABC transporter ATP-binding protein [Nitrospirae bacterium]|nr:ABC transporter ATP-binding protein [Nitrospirota bacterium]